MNELIEILSNMFPDHNMKNLKTAAKRKLESSQMCTSSTKLLNNQCIKIIKENWEIPLEKFKFEKAQLHWNLADTTKAILKGIPLVINSYIKNLKDILNR